MTDEDRPQAPQGGIPAPPGGLAPPPPPPATAPAPPPPASVPAPPPPTPAAAPAPIQVPDPVAAPAAPPKRRNGLLIALIIGFVLFCGISACLGVFLFASSGSGDDEIISQAEVHFSRAETSVSTVESAISAAGETDDVAKIAAAVAQADNAIRVSRDEIAAARASIEQLDDSQGRSDYLAALDAATLTLDGLQDLVGYLDTATGMAGKAAAAGDLIVKANANMESAIALGNKNSYTAMRAKAVAAAGLYAKATFLLDEADKLDTTAGLKKAASYTDKRRQEADILVRMADSGKAGRVSAYNADIKRQVAMGKAAVAIGLPAIISDPNWADKRLESLTASITAAATRTDQLHTQALTELDYRP